MNVEKGDVLIEFWYILKNLDLFIQIWNETFFLDIYFLRPFQQSKEGPI